MDDMKKALYLRARELLASGEQKLLGFALERALEELSGAPLGTYDLEDHGEELFPELLQIIPQPGELWSLHAGRAVIRSSPIEGFDPLWWFRPWALPRITSIDLLLNRE